MKRDPNFEIEVSEKRRIKRFNLKNALSTFLNAFNLERGILFTLLALIKSPGASTRHYLGEGRLKYSSPFNMLFLSTTLLILLIKFTGYTPGISAVSPSGQQEVQQMGQEQFNAGYDLGQSFGSREISEKDNAEKMEQIQEKYQQLGRLFNNYFNLILWLYIPIVSFFSWLFKRKSDLNYAEHLVFNSYYTTVINILSLGFFLSRLVNEAVLYLTYFIITIAYFVYYYRSLFALRWLRAVAEGLAIMIISAVVYGIAIALLGAFLLPLI